jgi:hypothetical protein
MIQIYLAAVAVVSIDILQTSDWVYLCYFATLLLSKVFQCFLELSIFLICSFFVMLKWLFIPLFCTFILCLSSLVEFTFDCLNNLFLKFISGFMWGGIFRQWWLLINTVIGATSSTAPINLYSNWFQLSWTVRAVMFQSSLQNRFLVSPFCSSSSFSACLMIVYRFIRHIFINNDLVIPKDWVHSM